MGSSGLCSLENSPLTMAEILEVSLIDTLSTKGMLIELKILIIGNCLCRFLLAKQRLKEKKLSEEFLWP